MLPGVPVVASGLHNTEYFVTRAVSTFLLSFFEYDLKEGHFLVLRKLLLVILYDGLGIVYCFLKFLFYVIYVVIYDVITILFYVMIAIFGTPRNYQNKCY